MDRTCIETESEQKNSGHKWMAKVHDDKKDEHSGVLGQHVMAMYSRNKRRRVKVGV